PPPSSPTLFPYTTLFRSCCRELAQTWLPLEGPLLPRSGSSTVQGRMLGAPFGDSAGPAVATELRGRLGLSRPSVHRATSRLPDRSEEHTSELQSPDHLVC